MRDEREEGYFADGAFVGKVKQGRSSLVDDTTAISKDSYFILLVMLEFKLETC